MINYLSKLIENKYNAFLEFKDNNYFISYSDGTISLVGHPFWNRFHIQSLMVNKNYNLFNLLDF